MNKETEFSEDEVKELAEELTSQLKSSVNLADDKESIRKMILGLGDQRGLLRRTFTQSLGSIGKATVPALREALRNHKSVTVRRAAAKTLKLVGDPSTLNDLLYALLNDPDPVVQGSSVGAMAIFGEQSVQLLLEVLLQPQSSSLQCGLAQWGLAFVGAKAADSLKNAAKSENWKIRAAAIAALGEQINFSDDQEAKKIVQDALSDESSEVRAEATILLSKINTSDATKSFLAEMLDDNSPEVRKNAALSIMKIGIYEDRNLIEKRKSIEKDLEVKKVLRFVISQLTKLN
tara:strand:+ start:3878 stop:4747 length:870 start_codon:yes stop_codon:yes gene_type:complete